MRYFATHAGKSVLFISGAAFLLAWPPALPWVAAVVMLQIGVRHITLAFKEVDRDLSVHSGRCDGPSLPAQGDGERGIAVNGRDTVRTRP